MKKLLLILLLFIPFNLNVYARECSVDEMAEYAKHLDDMDYILDYATDYRDEGKEGYFYLVFNKMPEGYHAEVGNIGEGFYILDQPNVAAPLTGGIYKLNFFHEDCDFAIKTYEVRVPYYKNFCNSEDCKNNSWFDGTYENKNTDNNKEDTDGKANKSLVIVLIFLTIILTALISLLTLKRKGEDHE